MLHVCCYSTVFTFDSLGLRCFNLHLGTQHSSLETFINLFTKKQKPSLPSLNFALFSLDSHRLARICSEQCLYICITSTSCVCLPLYNVSLIVFLNCKSLWIKASAKWMHANVQREVSVSHNPLEIMLFCCSRNISIIIHVKNSFAA